MSLFKTRTSQAPQSLNNGEAKATLSQYFELVIAGYNWLTNLIRIEEVNPLSQQYVEQVFVSSSNVTTSSLASPYYYPSSQGVSMNSYRDVAAELCLSSSSGSIFVYVEATTQTVASPEWVDITQMGYSYGANTGSYSTFSVATGSSNVLIAWENLNVDRIRFKTQVDYSNVNRIEIACKMKAH
jgi:hypothetical protein